jgi:hypothetical protein
MKVNKLLSVNPAISGGVGKNQTCITSSVIVQEVLLPI